MVARRTLTARQIALDAPAHGVHDLAKRWGVSTDTVRRWVKAGRLGQPVFLSPMVKRFTERQIRAFEESLPRSYNAALEEFGDAAR